MSGRAGDAPPANGGEFLLQLHRKPPSSNPPTPSPTQPPSQTFSPGSVVTAVGPTIPAFPLPHAAFPSNGHDLLYNPWNHSPSPPFARYNYFQQNPSGYPNLNPDFSSPRGGFNYTSHQFNLHSNRNSLSDDKRILGSYRGNFKPAVAHQQEQNLIFGSLNYEILENDSGNVLHQSFYRKNKLGNSYLEGLGMDRRLNTFPTNSNDVNGNARLNSSVLRRYEQERGGNSNNRRKQGDNGRYNGVALPTGFQVI